MAQRPVVHLFIGLHKVGSTAIRFMMDVHRGTFEHFGFHVPRACWTSYLNGVWNGGHNNIPAEICRNREFVAKYGTVADLAREIGSLPDRQHLLLSEDLDVATPEQIHTLRTAFDGFDVRVIVVVRNQVDWLQAIFTEEQKWYGATTFDEWYRTKGSKDGRLDYHALCRRWADAFGTVTVQVFEQIKTRVLDAFLESCGAPAGLRAALAERVLPVVNVTPGQFPLALIRHAAKVAGTAGLEPSFFNRMVMPASLAVSGALAKSGKRPLVITPEISADLFAVMKVTNQALAGGFGVSLGPEYLDPKAPASEAADETITIGVKELARVIVTTVCDASLNASRQIRAVGVGAAADGPSPISDNLREVVRRSFPWKPTDRSASPLLDELAASGFSNEGTGLYLERRQNERIAYRRVAGALVKIRDISPEDWESLMVTMHFRAGYGPGRGKGGFRQGFIEFDQNGRRMLLAARHAAGDSGELAILEQAA